MVPEQHLHQGHLDEALTTYKKALSIKPDNAEVYNNIGTALRDQGKLEAAIEAFKKALSIKPKISWGLFQYGPYSARSRQAGRGNRGIHQGSLSTLIMLKPTTIWVLFCKIKASWQRQ